MQQSLKEKYVESVTFTEFKCRHNHFVCQSLSPLGNSESKKHKLQLSIMYIRKIIK